MKHDRVIIITVIFVLVVIFLSVYFITGVSSREVYPQIQEKIDSLSKKFFGKTFPQCKYVKTHDSQGLLIDAVIIGKILNQEGIRDVPSIYLEKLPDQVGNIDRNGWYFVNLDWTDFDQLRADVNNLTTPEIILCKTRQTYRVCNNILPHKKNIFVGFTSIDKYVPVEDPIRSESQPSKYSKFIHIPGKSLSKGTSTVLRTWLRHPEWPNLTIVCRNEVATICQKIMALAGKTTNITIISEYLTEDQLLSLCNSHGIHICTSEYEGFGHYIHDAKSTEAVVLYTDMPCMNETFNDREFPDGIPVYAYQDYSNFPNTYCPSYKITEKSLQDAVEKVLSMPEEYLRQIGHRARQSYLEMDRNFSITMKNFVREFSPEK